MKKIIKYGLITIGFLISVSCEKEIPVTDIEKIEKELKEFVNNNEITKCNIILMYGESTYIEHEDADFSIGGGFVIVKASANGGTYEDRYNLLYLSRYRLSINNKLGLYFANTHY